MGYSISIGERIMGKWGEDVNDREMNGAPLFPNDPTAKTNTRCPSYTQWSNFCKEAGLTDLFFNKETGLMRDHPGICSLNENHLKIIEQARINWEKEHPGTIPGFEPDDFFPGPSAVHAPEGKEFDPILARLLWLEYWVRWSVFHLKNPAISNG